MDFTVYILYSATTDQFYIGQTCDLEKRLQEHNTGFYAHTYTSRANDWELFYALKCESREIAIRIERHLKSMRKKKYFQDIKKYPEISERLLERYRD